MGGRGLKGRKGTNLVQFLFPHGAAQRWEKVALGICALLFFAAIVAQWQVSTRHQPPTVADPVIGYRPKELTHTALGDTNAVSMRSSAIPSDDCATRVLLFGDSVLFGGELAQADLASTRLGKALGTSTWVGNVSAGGWAPNNIRGYISKYGWHDPDVIGFVLNSHDVAQLNPIDPKAKSSDGVYPFAALTLAAEFKRWLFDKFASPGPARSVAAEAVLRKLLADASARAPVFVFHNRTAEELDPYLPSQEASMERSRGKILRAIVEQAGARYIDMGPMLPRRDVFYADHIHLSRAGQQAMGEIMIRALRRVVAGRARSCGATP